MEAIKTFFSSMKLNNMRAALYAYLFNALFSIIAYFGFYTLFAAAAGDSLLAGETATKYGLFGFLTDLITNYKGSLPFFFSILFLLIILFILISIFLAGGIYSVLIEERKASFSNLFFSSAESFFPMLKLFLVNFLIWVIAFVIPLIAIAIFWKPTIIKLNESLVPVLFVVWGVVSIFILIFSTAIYDFSRIARLQEERNFLYAFKKGISFAFSNKKNILILFVLYGISLSLLYLINYFVGSLMENVTYAIFIFLVYQVIMFSRYYLKIVIMHAEVKIAEIRYEAE